MDDIPLPGLGPDPNPIEASAELPQLPIEGPTLPPEPSLPDEPPALPENPPAPSGDPPAPPEAPPVPLEEAPLPPDSLVSFFQGSDTPTSVDTNFDQPIQGPQLDPNASSSVSTANLTDEPHLTATAASVDATSSAFDENHPLQNITPNASAPGMLK